MELRSILIPPDRGSPVTSKTVRFDLSPLDSLDTVSDHPIQGSVWSSDDDTEFLYELSQTIIRGLKGNHPIHIITVEVSALRMAYNVPYTVFIGHLTNIVMTAASRLDRVNNNDGYPIPTMVSLHNTLSRLRHMLRKFITCPTDQVTILTYLTRAYGVYASSILYCWYDNQILDEEVILHTESQWRYSPNDGTDDFLTWLRTAEEDSEDSGASK